MSRLLFINQYYWPDEAATAQLLCDLAEDLVCFGHEVTVLCGKGRYFSEEKMEVGTYCHNGVVIERVGGTDFGRYHWGERVADILSFMWKAYVRLHRLPRHDVVIAMSSPPMIGKLAVTFHRKHHVPFILWAQDVYPEIAEKLGVLKNPILRYWLHACARQMYEESTKIIVPGEDMQKTLEDRKETFGKLHTIPNWADLEEITSTSVQQNTFRKVQGWEKDHVLMYSGNLGMAHELDTVLDLIVLLHVEMPSLRFVLVGDTPRHRIFAERVRSRGVHRISCLPFQPRKKLGSILGAADAHLVSQKAEADGFLVPSKFYGIVAAGRPVIFIGSRTSQVGRHIGESQLGAVILPGQALEGVGVAKKVILMTQDENGVVPYIRNWAKTHASRSIRTRQFQVLLEKEVLCR